MRPEIGVLLASYPRSRLALTPAHRRVYAAQYLLNRDGARPVEALAQRMERWMHRQVASVPGGPVLELGAGTLNHLRDEPPGTAYDIVEPFAALYRGRAELVRVRAVHASVHDVPRANRYRRCVSIAVLEHIEDLPRDVARAALLLEEGGVFQAGIPSEGGLLWWLGWRGTTGIAYRLRTGLDYGVVMRHEHVNSASEIQAVVGHLFRAVRVRRFPLPGLHSSFYTYLEARDPDRAAAAAILGEDAAGASAIPQPS